MNATITVHVRVNDAATGQPTPVRLRIAGLNGEFFAPFGRCVDFPVGRGEAVGGHLYLDGEKHIYIDGACEIRLPTGVPLLVNISKGPEFIPVRETVTLGPGQMALRFSIQRALNRHGETWASADSRCHFLSPHDALLEAAAEDLDLVHLLATEHNMPSQDGHLYRPVPNMTAFSGQIPALEANGRAIIVNTFNTHPVLGHLGLLNCHRPVFPLSFGGSDNIDDWSLCDWTNQCHRKKGLVVWCDAYRSGLSGGEALIAAILGRIDALEIDVRPRDQPLLPAWYRLLNAGVRLPLVGSSGKDNNRIALGSMRTYTLMHEQSRTLSDWVEQTRLGRTFVTNAPLLDFHINGESAGSHLTLAPGNAMLSIRAKAVSIAPFDILEILHDGKVIAQVLPNGEPCSASIETDTKLTTGGWLAARCRSVARTEPHWSPIFAHASPIYVSVDGQPPHLVMGAIRSLRNDVLEVRGWIEMVGRFAQEKRKIHLLELCDEALRILAEREAIADQNGQEAG